MTNPRVERVRWAVLVLALVAARAPFWWTGHVQEDAFITLRTAFNLADHGEYSFNVGERYPGATSLLYGHMVALIRKLSGPRALAGVQMANAILAVIGSGWLARAFFADRRHAQRLFVLLALMPVTLQLSYSGMETALVIFLLGHMGQCLTKDRPSAAEHLSAALLPLARPDAIVFPALTVLLARGWPMRRRVAFAAAAAVGTALGAIGSRLFTGSWLPSTALAKLTAYQPDRSLAAIANRLTTVLGRESFLVPVQSKFLLGTGFAEVVLVVAIVASLVMARRHRETSLGPNVLVLASWVWVVPLFFVVGTNLFPWYLWPSSWVASAIVAAALILGLDGLESRRRLIGWAAVTACICLLVAARFVLSVNWGAQSSRYLEGIGRYIGTVARPGDTLLLEPAGAIPFFSGLVTYDEVGLTSPRILPYLARDSVGNWLGFARDVRPTFTVQRDHFLAGSTALGYVLTADDKSWFEANYELIREFRFDPAQLARSPLEARILSLSTPVPYYVFRLRQASRGDRDDQQRHSHQP
jgi:hypothetical protein